jgi:hypothetical protein
MGSDEVEALDRLDERLAYTRGLYKELLDWYKSAESKASFLLTIDGIFTTILSGLVMTKSDDLGKILPHFTEWTWFFAASTLGFAVLSIFCAICCVWSRMIWPWKVENMLASNLGNRLAPGVMWFFQLVAEHPAERFVDEMLRADAELEIRARSANIGALAKNVVKKHWWVDFGFVFAAVSLVCLALLVASYVMAVAPA